MRRTAMFVAGVMLSIAALGAAVNSETEERYRAKYGRYTPSDEKRQKLSAKSETPVCCRNMNASFKNEPRENFAEALFRSKYGRSVPRVEAGERLAVEANAKYVRACIELGKCTLMQAEKQSSNAAPASFSRDEFYRAKYGRTLPMTRDDIRLSAAKVTCEHECCRRSD